MARSDRGQNGKRRGALSWLALAGILAALTFTACGEEETTDGGSSGGTLTTALSYNPGSLDPDVFYGNEGLLVTTSCYEGLLKYENDTTKIVPSLAESYEVSNGGRRYTFKLRPNVRFADGTKFDAEAMVFSIERRRAVDAGPAYMVAPVKASAPDPLTLVLDLDTPINPFPHWLASPYGLKAVNPKLVKKNEKDGDSAQEWMANNCAGTGPYNLTNVTPGQRYDLATNKYYWGTKPEFKTVVLKVIPNFATQALQLRSGELDMMTHGLTKADIKSFESNPGFEVFRRPGISATNLWINTNKPDLKDPETRRAIALALDRQALVDEVYGEDAELYNGVFAPQTLPPEHDYDIPTDPAQAKAIVEKLPASQRDFTLQFTSDDAPNQQIAGLIAQQLNDVGFTIKQRGLPITEVFNFTEAPESRRPEMIVVPQNPDDASPSSFPQLQWLSGEEAGGYFPPYDPAADKVFKKAVQSADPDKALELYGQAADMYRKTYAMVPIANTKAVIVARKGITNVGVERQGLWTVDLAELKTGPTASGQQ